MPAYCIYANGQCVFRVPGLAIPVAIVISVWYYKRRNGTYVIVSFSDTDVVEINFEIRRMPLCIDRTLYN
jgi:hypothetical protein